MGNPLSSIISKLVLDDLFKKIATKFDGSIKFMTKYVDDSLFVIQDSIFDELFTFINKFHNHIQFTYEKSCSNINFLDVSIFRATNNSIKCCHYKKPTYTGRIIHFLSHQPYHYKFNTACNLKEKWLKVSAPEFHHKLIGEF